MTGGLQEQGRAGRAAPQPHETALYKTIADLVDESAAGRPSIARVRSGKSLFRHFPFCPYHHAQAQIDAPARARPRCPIPMRLLNRCTPTPACRHADGFLQTPQSFDAFARFYDDDYRDYFDDLGLILDLAEEQGGPVLELGVGTGRVLLPLVDAGHTVTGVDIEPGAAAGGAQQIAGG